MRPRGTALRSRSSVPVAGSAHIATMTNATQVTQHRHHATRTSLIAGVPGSRCCRRRPRRHIATAGTVTVRLGDGHGRTVTSFGVHISASVSSWVLRLPGPRITNSRLCFQIRIMVTVLALAWCARPVPVGRARSRCATITISLAG